MLIQYTQCGMTALMFAARCQGIDIFRQLSFRSKTVRSINTSVDNHGCTVLHHAVYSNNVEILKILLFYGADTKVCDYYERRAIDLSPSSEVKLVLTKANKNQNGQYLKLSNNKGMPLPQSQSQSQPRSSSQNHFSQLLPHDLSRQSSEHLLIPSPAKLSSQTFNRLPSRVDSSGEGVSPTRLVKTTQRETFYSNNDLVEFEHHIIHSSSPSSESRMTYSSIEVTPRNSRPPLFSPEQNVHSPEPRSPGDNAPWSPEINFISRAKVPSKDVLLHWPQADHHDGSVKSKRLNINERKQHEQGIARDSVKYMPSQASDLTLSSQPACNQAIASGLTTSNGSSLAKSAPTALIQVKDSSRNHDCESTNAFFDQLKSPVPSTLSKPSSRNGLDQSAKLVKTYIKKPRRSIGHSPAPVVLDNSPVSSICWEKLGAPPTADSSPGYSVPPRRNNLGRIIGRGAQEVSSNEAYNESLIGQDGFGTTKSGRAPSSTQNSATESIGLSQLIDPFNVDITDVQDDKSYYYMRVRKQPSVLDTNGHALNQEKLVASRPGQASDNRSSDHPRFTRPRLIHKLQPAKILRIEKQLKGMSVSSPSNEEDGDEPPSASKLLPLIAVAHV